MHVGNGAEDAETTMDVGVGVGRRCKAHRAHNVVVVAPYPEMVSVIFFRDFEYGYPVLSPYDMGSIVPHSKARIRHLIVFVTPD